MLLRRVAISHLWLLKLKLIKIHSNLTLDPQSHSLTSVLKGHLWLVDSPTILDSAEREHLLHLSKFDWTALSLNMMDCMLKRCNIRVA